MQKKLPKITVVTPNYNQVDFIKLTIQSVLNQNYPNLEYIIIDGGSTDGSVDVISKYQDKLSYWVSEPDAGMYDAINKGFGKSSGDIMCWLNSDDILWENALFYVAAAFNQNPKINWLQGFPTVIDENGVLVYKRMPVFSKFYFYLKRHEKSFWFVQQESTFWTRTLWEKAGGKLNTDYSLASDFDLWIRFFKYDNMYCSKKQLGAFRLRQGQKSSNRSLYLDEANQSLSDNLLKLNILERLLIQFLSLLNKLSVKYKIRYLTIVNTKIANIFIGKPKFIKTNENQHDAQVIDN